MGENKFTEKDVQEILKEIAEKQGMTMEETRNELAIALFEGRDNPDPQLQAFWRSIPHKGEEITPEDVLAHIANIVKKKENL